MALRRVATESHATDREWHRCKQNEHGQIDRTGDRVSAADIVAKRPILECHGEQEFGCNQQSQGKQAGAQTNQGGSRQGEPLRDEAGSQDDDDKHERHFDEFSDAFAEAWHQDSRTGTRIAPMMKPAPNAREK